MLAIEIQDLAKTYKNGTRALKQINLQINEGEFFALLGANGAGKTTIIGILTGIVNKTGGTAKIFGLDSVQNPLDARHMIGVVPQEMNFNMFEKAIDILIAQAGYFGIESHEAKIYAEYLLKRLELWDKRNTPSRMLSGGMKRRLMIARALINKPKLLILDEPTAGVDVELRHTMWDFLRELNKNGTTILLTTHYLEEVEQMCERAAIIKSGEIITCDSVKNLVGLVEEETYVVHVDQLTKLQALERFGVRKIDDTTFEVELTKSHKLNDLIRIVHDEGMSVIDIRPKGNRLEKLFLSILKDKISL